MKRTLPEPTVANACRTRIEIDFPSHGATLQSEGSDPAISVTGTVASNLGEITELS
ncbi:MAG: hypothetical protein KJO40_20715 [Deltaproteobacteria bacterium]|nr:hypothetical protein [Deltaproteobacteria bacterium]